MKKPIPHIVSPIKRRASRTTNLSEDVRLVLKYPLRIIYIKADGNKVKFFLLNGVVKVHKVMFREVMACLNKKMFLQTHNSYIISTLFYLRMYLDTNNYKVELIEFLDITLAMAKLPYDYSKIHLKGIVIPVGANFLDEVLLRKDQMACNLMRRYKKRAKHILLYCS